MNKPPYNTENIINYYENYKSLLIYKYASKITYNYVDKTEYIIYIKVYRDEIVIYNDIKKLDNKNIHTSTLEKELNKLIKTFKRLYNI